MDVGGTEPHPFGHPRPETLDEHVGVLDQPQHHLDPFGSLRVDPDGSATTQQWVLRHGQHVFALDDPVDAHDLRPEVREDRAGEGCRGQTGQFDDPEPA